MRSSRRVIKGITRKTQEFTATDVEGVLGKQITMTFDVSKDLPPNTIHVSADWLANSGDMRLFGDACLNFIKTISKQKPIYEIRGSLAAGLNDPGPHEFPVPPTEQLPFNDTRNTDQKMEDHRRELMFRNFIVMFAVLRHASPDERDISLSTLKFDTLCRMVFPINYAELGKIRFESAQSRIAHALGLRIQSTEYNTDALSERIVERFYTLIGQGQWGKF